MLPARVYTINKSNTYLGWSSEQSKGSVVFAFIKHADAIKAMRTLKYESSHVDKVSDYTYRLNQTAKGQRLVKPLRPKTVALQEHDVSILAVRSALNGVEFKLIDDVRAMDDYVLLNSHYGIEMEVDNDAYLANLQALWEGKELF